MWHVMTRIGAGMAAALRFRPGVFVAVAAAVFAIDLFLPPALLSVLRKPFDYVAFNAWLPQLPAYLFTSQVPLPTRLDFLANLALFWFSADSAYGGVEWGFAVTVGDLLRILSLSLLFGAYFALVFRRRDQALAASWSPRRSGAAGVLASVFGLSTGGCTVMGCGAPVIPVVGLAFVGLSSGALALLAELSRVATIAVFAVVTLAVLYLAWRTGGGPGAARLRTPAMQE